jgi:hypothetical protein
LATQEQQLEVQVDRQGQLVEMGQSIAAFCQRVQAGLAQATFAQKRTLVELLIDRVLVANGDGEIRYAIPTHPRGEMTRFCQLRKDYFYRIIQILALPQSRGLGERAFLVEGLECWGIRGVLVDRDDAGYYAVGSPQGFAEKLLSGLCIAGGTQHEVNRRTRRIDGAIKVVPVLFDLDIGFIHAVRIIGPFQPWPAAFVQLGSIPLDPSEDGGMVNP